MQINKFCTNNKANNLGIIILNYNAGNLSIKAAMNILQFDLNIKVIIVDNCSTDNSREILEKNKGIKNLYIIYNKVNSGYAAGNNYGAKWICENLPTIDTLCIMNPDVVISDANTLVTLYEKINEHKYIGALTTEVIMNGNYSDKRNPCAWKFFTEWTMLLEGGIIGRLICRDLYYESLHCYDDNIALVDVVQGCLFVIKKETFCEIKGFDENTFLYYEEMILAKRLEKIGKKCGVCLDLFINHNHKVEKLQTRKLQAKYFEMRCYLESRIYYLENYMNTSQLYKIVTKKILQTDYYIKKAILKLILNK